MKNVVASVRLCLGALLFLLAGLAEPKAWAQAPDWRMEVVANPSGGPLPGSINLYSIMGMAADSVGDIYLTGTMDGIVSFGSTVLVSAGYHDAFVAKWNSSSRTFAWVTRMGGIGQEAPIGIAVNSHGVYIAGTFGPVGGMARPVSAPFGLDTLRTSYMDVFVAKLTPTGSIVWAKQTSGTGAIGARALAVNGRNVYVAGPYNSPVAHFGSIALPLGTNSSNNGDMYVAKLTDTGANSSFIWAQSAGGTYSDDVAALAVVGPNVYVAGPFDSPTIHFGPTTLTNAGVRNSDVYVAKLTDAGTTSSFTWGVRAGNSNSDYAAGLAASGTSLYFTGGFFGTSFGIGSRTLFSAGHYDIYLAKLTDAGSTGNIGWVEQMGGTGFDSGSAVTAFGSTVYASGRFASTAGIFGNTLLSSTLSRNPATLSEDAFVTKFTDTGATAVAEWAIQGGGSGYDGAYRLGMNGPNLCIAGQADAPSVFGSQSINGSFVTQSTFFATLAAVPPPAPPRLMSFSPGSAPTGTTINLTGTNFTNAAGLSFNGIAAPGFVVNATGTALTVTVPAGASSGLLRVSTPGGTAISSTPFTVQTGLGTAAAQVPPLLLSPNPAHHTATLALPAFAPTEARALTLHDALGRDVRRFAPGPGAAGTPYTMDLTGLAPGFYLLQAGAARARLVVE